MIAKIIKLNDYLNEYISVNQPNVIVGIANILDISEDVAKELYNKLTRQQEVDLVTSLMSNSLNDEQKIAVAHSIFDPIIVTTTKQPFGGVDIAEGYNFRREVTNEVARNNIMDWLEENNIEYLIDNLGNFAVKCTDRKSHYKVNRQFEHILNKWDNGPIGRNVDPTIHRKALSFDMKGNILSDALSEAAQDGSMPLSDMSGTPPLFPATNTKNNTTNLSFKNTKENAMKILGDYVNPSSEIYAEKLDEKNGEWLVCDDAVERSFVVDTHKGNFEEVKYICESSGPTRGFGHAPGRMGPRPDDPRGYKHDMPTTFDQSGVEIAYDPVMKKTVERFANMIKNVNLDILVDATKKEKIDLMIKYNAFSRQDLENPSIMKAALKKYDVVVKFMYDIKAKGGDPYIAIKEAKNKSATQRTKDAKKKLDKMIPGKGGAGAIAQGTFKKNAGPHDKKGYDRKEKHKKPVIEGVLGGATNMTDMPTIGISRLRELAGLSEYNTTIIDIEPVKTPTKNEPIVVAGKEIRDMEEALDHLNEVFNIYKKLNTVEKKEIRINLINTIMNEGGCLSESIIDLLLDNKPSVLLEFDGEGDHLTKEDKEYLKMVIGDIKMTIFEDIKDCENSVSVSLARIAYLLEALQEQMEK